MSTEETSHDAEVRLEQTEGTTTPENTKLPVFGQLVLLSALLLLIFGSALTPKLLALFDSSKSKQAAAVTSERPKSTFDRKEQGTAFDAVSITAKAAYVWDIKAQKVLYKKNEAETLPLASITKLMTALVADEILASTTKVTINAQSVRQDSGSGLTPGEIYKKATLSDMVLMSSSNDGAFALAAAAGDALGLGGDGASTFVDAMNLRAGELGLTGTYFKNPTGLDLSATEGGAYGSARDIAFLMEHIVKNRPDILTYTKEHAARFYNENGTYHDAENTNDFIHTIPGLIGSKTGYTDLAGGNLVIAWNAGLDRPLVAVVLGSTQRDRFTDIRTLVNAALLDVSAAQTE